MSYTHRRKLRPVERHSDRETSEPDREGSRLTDARFDYLPDWSDSPIPPAAFSWF